MKINDKDKGYYNIIDDTYEKEWLIHNLHQYREYLKNGIGRAGDWIDETFLQFKTTTKNNNDNGTKEEEKIHYLSYTIWNPNELIVDGIVYHKNKKYIEQDIRIQMKENNHNKKSFSPIWSQH